MAANADRGGADVEAKGNDGRTAAMFASYGGHEECLQTLIQAGADVEARGNDRRTAATLAVGNGHPELASLIEALALARRERSKTGAAIDPAKPRVSAARVKIRV